LELESDHQTARWRLSDNKLCTPFFFNFRRSTTGSQLLVAISRRQKSGFLTEPSGLSGTDTIPSFFNSDSTSPKRHGPCSGLLRSSPFIYSVPAWLLVRSMGPRGAPVWLLYESSHDPIVLANLTQIELLDYPCGS